jgi:serine O-acetyltransferase
MTIWQQIYQEAEQALKKEPDCKHFLTQFVLKQESLKSALAAILSNKITTEKEIENHYNKVFNEILDSHPEVVKNAEKDLKAIKDRDPACKEYLTPFLYYKGFLAIQIARIAKQLWQNDRKYLAYDLQHRNSMCFAVDIHPNVEIGHGLLLDHATSFVAGETAKIGNNVSILHEVTLGGTGKESGDRHPKIADGVLIGAGSKLLGNIKIGKNSKIGAGSVVLKDVADHVTVVGVPAKVVGTPSHKNPAKFMDQQILTK